MITPMKQVLRARRRRLGLTQREVANIAGCAERTVRAFESGKATIGLDVAQRILAALGLGFELGNGRGTVTVNEELAK